MAILTSGNGTIEEGDTESDRESSGDERSGPQFAATSGQTMGPCAQPVRRESPFSAAFAPPPHNRHHRWLKAQDPRSSEPSQIWVSAPKNGIEALKSILVIEVISFSFSFRFHGSTPCRVAIYRTRAALRCIPEGFIFCAETGECSAIHVQEVSLHVLGFQKTSQGALAPAGDKDPGLHAPPHARRGRGLRKG